MTPESPIPYKVRIKDTLTSTDARNQQLKRTYRVVNSSGLPRQEFEGLEGKKLVAPGTTTKDMLEIGIGMGSLVWNSDGRLVTAKKE